MGNDQGNSKNRNTWGGFTSSVQSTVPDPSPEEIVREAWSRQGTMVRLSLLGLLADGSGYLRLIPDSDGTSLHLKFKFTRGPWQGRYIYYRSTMDDVHEGLRGLLDKLEQVHEGIRTPVPDKVYES